MRIKVTLDVPDTWADPAHRFGITGAGYNELCEALAEAEVEVDEVAPSDPVDS